jgi:hypothetical protein
MTFGAPGRHCSFVGAGVEAGEAVYLMRLILSP